MKTKNENGAAAFAAASYATTAHTLIKSVAAEGAAPVSFCILQCHCWCYLNLDFDFLMYFCHICWGCVAWNFHLESLWNPNPWGLWCYGLGGSALTRRRVNAWTRQRVTRRCVETMTRRRIEASLRQCVEASTRRHVDASTPRCADASVSTRRRR